MELSQDQLKEQIERCRRLAAEITDYDIRQSLYELAAEYEERLKRKDAGFMLQRKSDSA